MSNISTIIARFRAVYHRYVATTLHASVPMSTDTPIYDQLEREWASRWTR